MCSSKGKWLDGLAVQNGTRGERAKRPDGSAAPAVRERERGAPTWAAGVPTLPALATLQCAAREP